MRGRLLEAKVIMGRDEARESVVELWLLKVNLKVNRGMLRLATRNLSRVNIDKSVGKQCAERRWCLETLDADD